jgi:agmatinase
VLNYRQSAPFNFLGLPAETSDYATSPVVVWPVPLERTTTYMAGTGRGPRAIIEASRAVETWDEELEAEACLRGIHTLPEIDTRHGAIEEVLRALGKAATALLEDGKFFLALGGEHSLTPPLVAACAAKSPGLSVLQIDAHADLRAQYEGSPHSHACALRRVLEICPAVQVGIRSLSVEEAEAIPRLPTRVFFARDLHRRPPGEWIPEIVGALGDPVYLTLDIDGLDPALVPATGTPEPGGLGWYDTLALLRAVFERKRVVAADLVELLPQPGQHASDFLCARLAYKIIVYKLLLGR